MNEIDNEETEYLLDGNNNEKTLEINDKYEDWLILPKENDIIDQRIALVKENLIFDYKYPSLFKIYCHFGGTFLVFIMILATIATIASGCSEALKAVLVGDALNILSILDTNSDSDIIYNEMILYNVESEIGITIKKFLIFGSLLFIFDFFSIFLWFYFDLKLLHNFEVYYFSLILEQKQEWFDQNNAFEFATKVQAQLEGVESGLLDNPRFVILYIIDIISGYIIGFKTSWKLTLILSGSSLPFVIICFILNIYSLEKQTISDIKRLEKAGGIAEELLFNIKTVASFANFDYEIERYENAFENNEEDKRLLNKEIIMEIALFGSYFGFIITAIYSRTLIVSEYNNVNKNILFTAGDVITVLFSVRNSVLIMNDLIPILLTIKESCASASDYFNLYEISPKIENLSKNIMPNKELIKGKIEFKNVKFTYPTDKKKELVLKGINLLIEAGKRVAIVGESGAGKTTIMKLIERLYEPSEGQILLDGIDLKDYNLEYLRSLFGFVKQDYFLFNQSIKHNVVFGRENSITEFEDIDTLLKEACNGASINDYIEKRPEQYEYNVGVKGKKLLPNYRKCLSIARGIFGHPKILILDEPISDLDYEAEKKVLKLLDYLNERNITLIIIGNKPNVLYNVDKIYALKDGQIIEEGNHEELMAKNGYYSKLIKTEYKEEILIEEDIKENEKVKFMRKISKKHFFLKGKTLRCQLGQKGEEHVEFRSSQLFNMVKEYKLDLFLGTICGILFGLGSTYLDFLIGKLQTELALKDNEMMKKNVLKCCLIILIVVLIWVICDYINNTKLEELGSIITSKTRRNLIQKYLELHLSYYDFEVNPSPGLLSILAVDTNILGCFFSTVYNSIFCSVGLITTALVMGFLFSWRLTLILFIFIPIRIAFAFLSGKFKFDGKTKYKQIRIKARSFFSECVTNTKSIFPFNFQKSAVNIYKNILDKEIYDYILDSIFIGICISSINLLTYIASSAAYKCGIIFIRQKIINFEALIEVKKTLMSFIDNEIYFRIRGFWDYSRVILAFKYIYKILNTTTEINAFEYANENCISPDNLKGKIEFKNVTFAYPVKPSKDILKNVSFVIPPGKKVAIIGNTESGKSTILRLIERFFDIYEGEILIDDINIKDYNLFELRKKIGLIRQKETLFKRSIYDNILYGNLNATKEEVIDAAKKAGIGKLLTDKSNTLENSISEGEKQRISLARIFLKNPVILLFDNVLSKLDSSTENEIHKNIDEFQKEKTSIVITHRLNKMEDYDLILFMDNGKLVEQGTHKELMKLKGYYYNLYMNEQ